MFRNSILWAAALSTPLVLGCNSTDLPGAEPGGASDEGSNNAGCVGRQCDVNYNCPAVLGPTTVTGTVTIPAGTLPLYNAKVYIPSGDVPAEPATGASCDRCDQVVPPDSVTSTTTDINGSFTLTNVPHGANIPLIIRVGKWRRVVTMANIRDCTSTPLAAGDTRLPRNSSEGHIPRIALSTGNADALECILRSKKLGIDDSEFTPEGGKGRVNLFGGANGANTYSVGFNGATTEVIMTTAQTPNTTPSWYDNLANLTKYDIVMLSCEGARHMEYKSATAVANMERYINQGGRVFASHWHNGWIASGNPNAPYDQKIQTVATFPNSAELGSVNDTINTAATFIKGNALASWLILPTVWGTDIPPIRGALPVGGAKSTIGTISATLTQSWVYYKHANGNRQEQYFAFNAPVGAPAEQQCGQMVFTDLHVSSGSGGDSSARGTPFPEGCTADSLSAQEKALIFMLFDLTNCLQPGIG